MNEFHEDTLVLVHITLTLHVELVVPVRFRRKIEMMSEVLMSKGLKVSKGLGLLSKLLEVTCLEGVFEGWR